AVCTPLAQGWEMIDDAPTINDAIASCGNGGTIILPQGQIYSIRSPINFTPCKYCDLQIEGQILVSRDDWAYWAGQDSIFTVAGVKGVMIRSLTGKGVIDGNAIDFYHRPVSNDGWNRAPPLLHVTNGSSYVVVDNLLIKNPPMRFFRAEGNSTKITYSRLNLSVVEQYGINPWSESMTFGFELGDVSEVTIDSVAMDFRARSQTPNTIGVCVAFDRGTNGITVKNVTCKGAWGGVLVMVGTMAASVG
ncbi:pectin lyase-like protein, partial [Lindgomyces ingoldianus]